MWESDNLEWESNYDIGHQVICYATNVAAETLQVCQVHTCFPFPG